VIQVTTLQRSDGIAAARTRNTKSIHVVGERRTPQSAAFVLKRKDPPPSPKRAKRLPLVACYGSRPEAGTTKVRDFPFSRRSNHLIHTIFPTPPTIAGGEPNSIRERSPRVP